MERPQTRPRQIQAAPHPKPTTACSIVRFLTRPRKGHKINGALAPKGMLPSRRVLVQSFLSVRKFLFLEVLP